MKKKFFGVFKKYFFNVNFNRLKLFGKLSGIFGELYGHPT